MFSRLLMICFLNIPLLGQWTEMGDYKELNAGNPINQLIVPKDENSFYIADRNNALIKYDYAGKNISKFQSRKLESDDRFCRFSDDCKSYSIYRNYFLVINAFVSGIYYFDF